MSVFVIGEPGCTAEGDFDAFVRLIHAAGLAGADAVKAQWTSDHDQVCARRNITPDHPKHEYYRKAYGWLNFPVEWHASFSALCKSLGMQYGCTSYLPQDVATVDPFVDFHKISSFEAKDHRLWRACQATGKRWMVSTGMMDGDGIEVVRIGRFSDDCEPEREILLCTSAYPAPVESANLLCMEVYGLDGLSDHSRDLLTGAVAVGAGARIIETHYRLFDCDPDNPDYPVAFDPGEFTRYILNIRKAERLMGTGEKRIHDSEHWALPYRVTA